jgi:hypothetical protein
MFKNRDRVRGYIVLILSLLNTLDKKSDFVLPCTCMRFLCNIDPNNGNKWI